MLLLVCRKRFTHPMKATRVQRAEEDDQGDWNFVQVICSGLDACDYQADKFSCYEYLHEESEQC